MWRTSGWNALPEGRAAEAPVWLPHAVIARGHRLRPDPSAPDSLCMIWGSHVRIFLSLLANPDIVPPPIILRDCKKSGRMCASESPSVR